MDDWVRSPAVLTATGRNWPPLPNAADATAAVVFVAVTQPEETAATEKTRGGPENPSRAWRSFQGAPFSAVTLLWLWMSPGREGEVKGVSGSVGAAVRRTDGRTDDQMGSRETVFCLLPPSDGETLPTMEKEEEEEQKYQRAERAEVAATI